jgi:ketosteroid isomerase-like protein
VTTPGREPETTNLAIVRDAFDAWVAGTGGPFDLLADDVRWTIVGNAPVSRTYQSKREFIDTVIDPLNERLSVQLVPRVRRLYADGDTVIALFDASGTATDGRPYENTYSWYLRLDGGRIVEVMAFLDTIALTDLWTRVPVGGSGR